MLPAHDAHNYRRRGRPYPPSSFARAVAATTASMSTPRMPRCSSTANPAIVVPPGLETRSLICAGCSPVYSKSAAVPERVCTARASGSVKRC